MEFKPFKNYTQDEICVLYTLVKVPGRHAFVNRMVSEGKISYNNKTKTYEAKDEELKAFLDGTEQRARNESYDVVRRLMDVFPAGRKHYGSGGSKPWKGNEAEVRRKLDAMFKFNGSPIDDDTLVEAAKRYVASFTTDTTLMRTLPYFLLKKTDDNGLVSDMLSAVEDVRNNMSMTTSRQADWTSSMV